VNALLNNYLTKLWHSAAWSNNQIFASLIEPATTAKILDLGCDNGEIFINRINRKIRKPYLYGIDIDAKKLKYAEKLGIKTIRANVEKKLPFPDACFDIVSANQLIEHLLNSDGFLKEIFRVLKPKGYLILATENLAATHNIAALLFGWHPFSLHASSKSHIGNPLRIGRCNTYAPEEMHIKVFTLRSLKELVELHGFKVEKSYGAGYYPFPKIISGFLSRCDQIHAAFIGLKARKPK
jgi:SAM-dependent methyltransferase